MTKIKGGGLKAVLKDTKPYFFMMKSDGYERLRLLEVRDDSIVIATPKGAPMRKTMLGIIALSDGSGVIEVDGRVEAEEGAIKGSIRLSLDPDKLRKLERRAFPRVSFAPPLEATATPEGKNIGIPVRIINLSAGGLRVETREALPPDRLLKFRFNIDLEDEVHELDLEGRVVYEIPLEGGHSYGVKFGRTGSDTTVADDEEFVSDSERTADLISLVNRLLIRE